jgi:hypothetical protein
MTMHDADLGDVYVDARGKLWRVVALCREPTVHVEEIEREDHREKARLNGGVSGYMWRAFKRIYRPEPIDSHAAAAAEVDTEAASLKG